VRGLFVTGTDTGVGKSVLAAAIVAGVRSRGVPVRALKPLITGLDEPPEPDWPRDHELLARVAGCEPDEVIVAGYGPSVSPHLAAELIGEELDPTALLDAITAAPRDGELLVVEAVGGLLVPLARGYDVRALARDLGLPVLIAARPGLGTINHTLLTIEAARSAGLRIAGVVMTPWPVQPGTLERSNRETVERLGRVAVSGLPFVCGADPDLLARASERLPLEHWLQLAAGAAAAPAALGVN
jgi:dethiobiotin synthetase